MPVESTCPGCGCRLRVPEQAVGTGRPVSCPKCRKQFVLPGGTPPAAGIRAAPPPAGGDYKDCPFCGEPIRVSAVKCKHCGESLDRPPTPARRAARPLLPRELGPGKLSWSGPYDAFFDLVAEAMTDCGVKLKEQSRERGLLRGKSPYGINLFGMTVTATFYAAGGETRAEITANFTDAFDTFGACAKKVAAISSRVLDLAEEAGPARGAAPAGTDSAGRAPSFEQRAGASFRGQALTGFVFALFGLCVPLAALLGLVFAGVALNGMNTSANQEGKGWAIAGLVIGFVGLVGWVVAILLWAANG